MRSPPRHLELVTLQDLQEEEAEGEEDSPLRQDFGDFASFEPASIKNSFGSRFRMDSYGENSKTTPNCHDMNSSNVPLKAGFDDFDGVSADSIASVAKDALNLPFVEESLKSVKSSPFINASRGNLSQLSTSNRSATSPKNPSGKRSFLGSPNSSKIAANPDYENGSPEILSAAEKRETVPLRLDFPSIDAIDIDNGMEKKEALSPVEYVNKPETLNNGYIGGTAT